MRRFRRRLSVIRLKLFSKLFCRRFGHRWEIVGRELGFDNSEIVIERCRVCGADWRDDGFETHPNCRCHLIEGDPFADDPYLIE